MIRCEGWERFGGIFTFGPVRWVQCPNDAVVMLKVKQDGKVSNQPACLGCWGKGKTNKIKIISSVLLPTQRKRKIK